MFMATLKLSSQTLLAKTTPLTIAHNTNIPTDHYKLVISERELLLHGYVCNLDDVVLRLCPRPATPSFAELNSGKLHDQHTGKQEQNQYRQ